MSYIYMLCTAGGMGKSTLGRALYNRHLKAFQRKHRRAVAVIERVDSHTAPDDILKQLLTQLDGAESAEAFSQKLLRLRQILRERAVLLLLDNLWTVEQLERHKRQHTL